MFVYDVICSGYDQLLNSVNVQEKEKCIKKDYNEDTKSTSVTHDLISNNIETLRNDIKLFIDDNRSEYVFSNPTRFLMSYDVSDERNEWENNENDEMISVDKLRNDENAETKKINDALNSAVEKEVFEFAEKEFGEKMSIKDFDWNIDNIKGNTIYKINGINKSNKIDSVNINSNKFGSYIDKISQLFDKCTIVKPVLSDPYSDEIYMIFGNKKNDACVENRIPINYENYIDFLYSIYSYAIYVLNLVRDIKYKTNSSKIEFINLSTKNEYKFIVEKCKKKMVSLGIIRQE